MEITDYNTEVLKQYSETLDKNLLYNITSETVASVLHTIFIEAVRTYNEDLPLDEEYVKTNSITTTFYTDIKLYDPQVVFWEHYNDPWYVVLTIDDNQDSPIEWEYHNHQEGYLSLNEVTGKLQGIHCKMDIYASHKTWKLKYLTVLLYNIEKCYIRWKKMQEIGIDDEGYVVTPKLARRILKQWILQRKGYMGIIDITHFDEKQVFWSDCNDAWNIANNIDEDTIDSTCGFNGLRIRRYLDAYIELKDMGYEDPDEISADICSNGVVILEGNNNTREIFVFHEGD